MIWVVLGCGLPGLLQLPTAGIQLSGQIQATQDRPAPVAASKRNSTAQLPCRSFFVPAHLHDTCSQVPVSFIIFIFLPLFFQSATSSPHVWQPFPPLFCIFSLFLFLFEDPSARGQAHPSLGLYSLPLLTREQCDGLES
ncbi:hypothetical protein B0J13DRAFT_528867 [Dactylonectria estremocensis]|uniref:Uncharacterized protein n=1 Tax=Dactylonectria estremocensis TaxID=1079267 RepID=A0A9P9IWE1_9HYPO|nr:hypothetical protein B0J13DRAFT_528867 [Dactylonectria estremocensis]